MTDLSFSSLLRLLNAADAVEDRISGAIAAVHGLSLKEVFLLMHLENSPADRLSRVELSRRLHVSASTVTRMTAPLEKIGMVDRETDPRDARLAFVVLTEAGKERIGEARATLARQAERVFSDRWSNTELNQLSELLGRLLANQSGTLG